MHNNFNVILIQFSCKIFFDIRKLIFELRTKIRDKTPGYSLPSLFFYRFAIHCHY